MEKTVNSEDKPKKKRFDLRTPVKIVAMTGAGAGLGILAAVGTVTAAAVGEVVLPALLLIKIAGVTGGAVGVVMGMGRKPKSK